MRKLPWLVFAMVISCSGADDASTEPTEDSAVVAADSAVVAADTAVDTQVSRHRAGRCRVGGEGR